MENEKETEKNIKLFLIRIGIRCDFVGFTYLVEATKIVLKEPQLIHNLKKVFKMVAEICQPEYPDRVEANIQNAISFTYKKKGFESLNKFFGTTVLCVGRKPATGELIELCAQYVRLGLYKNEVIYDNGDILVRRADSHKKQA